MSKLAHVLRICARWLAGCMLLYLMAVLLLTWMDTHGTKFFDYTGRSYVTDMAPDWFLLALGLAVVAVLMLIVGKCRWQRRDAAGKYRLLWITAALVLLLLQTVVAYSIWFYAGTDTSLLWQGAGEFAAGQRVNQQTVQYLQMCPNNLYVYILYIAAHRIGALLHINAYVLMIGVCVVLSNLAVQLSADCARRITGSPRITVGVWLLSALLFGLSPWITMPYTDTLSIAIPILTVNLYLVLKDSRVPLWGRVMILVLIPGFFGYLKILNIIVLIAMVITELLYLRRKDITWHSIVSVMVAVAVSLVLLQGLHQAAERVVDFRHDPTQELGMGYWVALGTNAESYGAWNPEDVELMQQQDSPAEVNQVARELLAQRNAQYGISGWIHLYVNKTHLFYNDGTFGWSFSCGYYDRMLQAKGKLQTFLRNVYYPPYHYGLSMADTGYGSHYMLYAMSAQALWLVTLAGITVLALTEMFCHEKEEARGRHRTILLLLITWVGVFLFTMLFETSSRLLVSYLPIFTLMAGLGYDVAFQKLSQKDHWAEPRKH